MPPTNRSTEAPAPALAWAHQTPTAAAALACDTPKRSNSQARPGFAPTKTMRIAPMRPVPTGIALVVLALLSALLGAGCSSTTQLTSTWRDPGAAPRPYRNLLVFGIAANGNVRRAYENNFVVALRARGVKARAGHDLLPEGGLGEVNAVKRVVGQSGADGIIVTHLVGATAQTVVVSPRSYVDPNLYGSLYPYYQRVFGYVTEPGYYATYPVLQLETNLYDAARQKLVWSTRSETMDPGSETTTIKDVIAAVTQGLAAAGYLPN
ncbi:hypothetical protein [Candidatus Thiodictyon syntrophicum]|nr:hypothetical protein [Candidatus Thiodictyon syntrophicum]